MILANENGMLPIHEQISETLRSRIRSGELSVGTRLPTEADLMDEFGAARGTVRRALRTLNEAGIVQTLQGKGTYVRSGRPEPSIAQTLVGLGESLSYSEKSLTTRVLAQEVLTGAQVDNFPGEIDPGEKFLFLDRIRYLDGVPVARLKNWVRIALAPGIETTNFEEKALFEALEDGSRRRVSSGRRTFEAVLADKEIANSLGVSGTVPLLFLTQITYLEGGTIVEYSDVWMDSKQVTVSMNLTR